MTGDAVLHFVFTLLKHANILHHFFLKKKTEDLWKAKEIRENKTAAVFLR